MSMSEPSRSGEKLPETEHSTRKGVMACDPVYACFLFCKVGTMSTLAFSCSLNDSIRVKHLVDGRHLISALLILVSSLSSFLLFEAQ